MILSMPGVPPMTACYMSLEGRLHKLGRARKIFNACNMHPLRLKLLLLAQELSALRP